MRGEAAPSDSAPLHGSASGGPAFSGAASSASPPLGLAPADPTSYLGSAPADPTSFLGPAPADPSSYPGPAPAGPGATVSPTKRGPDRRHTTGSAAPDGTERRHGADRRLHGYVRDTRIFAGVPHEAIEVVLAHCPVTSLPAGTVLLRPGVANDAIHVLLAGLLHIRLEGAHAADGIAITPGDCIGELSIIDGKPVSAYVVAAEDCSVMRIPADIFWEELIPMPGVARNLMRLLSDRMRQNNELIIKRMAEHLRLELLERDLQAATGIQASMLPALAPLFAGRGDLDLHATMHAARDVGGDFYDAFFISPTRLFIAIGDVSGKGVPAALFMARSMTLLRMEAVRDHPPHEILANVNNMLCAGNSAGMFVTVFCAVLDTETGLLTFSNGGHNPPLHTGAERRYAYMDPPRGLVLGIIEDAPFASATLALEPGHSLLLYTDGVTEASDHALAMYTEERLLACLHALESASTAASTIAAIHLDVQTFVAGAEPSDDITMLALTWHGKEGKPQEDVAVLETAAHTH